MNVDMFLKMPVLVDGYKKLAPNPDGFAALAQKLIAIETEPMAWEEDVEKIKAVDTQGIFYEYEAGHGFSCDRRPSFNPEAAALARQRTLEFFGRKLAGKV